MNQGLGNPSELSGIRTPTSGLSSLVRKLNLKDAITCTSDPATRIAMGGRTHSPKFIRGVCVLGWDAQLPPDYTNSGHHGVNTNPSPTKSHIASEFSKTQCSGNSPMGVAHEWTSSPHTAPPYCVRIRTWQPVRWFQVGESVVSGGQWEKWVSERNESGSNRENWSHPMYFSRVNLVLGIS